MNPVRNSLAGRNVIKFTYIKISNGMKRNKGIAHIVIIIIGIIIALVLLGFFNSVSRNSKLLVPNKSTQQ